MAVTNRRHGLPAVRRQIRLSLGILGILRDRLFDQHR
jgi:hypothetical protein